MVIISNFFDCDNTNDTSDLMQACMSNDYEKVVYQVETLKADVNYITKDRQCALLRAIFKNNLNIVKYLHEHGAVINISDHKQNTLLMMSIYLRQNDISAYLIISGINILAKNKYNESAMHFCGMTGNIFIMKLLLERDALINELNIRNHSPIILACGNKYTNVVKFLINEGANINVIDHNNDSKFIWKK